MKIGELFEGIAWLVGMVVKVLTTAGGTISGTKNVLDLFNTVKNRVKPDAPATVADLEAARASADLIRSLALFGFLEYVLWATKAVVLMRLCDNALRRLQRIVAMQSPEP